MSFSIFSISGSALMAQTQRMNISASNLANAVDNYGYQNSVAGVKVSEVIEDPAPMNLVYEPNHPLADERGYIQKPNVDVVAEMVNTISASRSYQANVEVINTAKSLMLKTLTLGQ